MPADIALALALPIALGVDRLWGEPPVRVHPVVAMGAYLRTLGPRLAALAPMYAWLGGTLAWCVAAATLAGSGAWLEGALLEPLLALHWLLDKVPAAECGVAVSLEQGRVRPARLVIRGPGRGYAVVVAGAPAKPSSFFCSSARTRRSPGDCTCSHEWISKLSRTILFWARTNGASMCPIGTSLRAWMRFMATTSDRLPARWAVAAGLRVQRMTTIPALLVLGWAAPAQADPPQRIVSLNLCTDQLLLQVVPRERIASLSRLSQDPFSAALHRDAQGLRTVGGSAEEVLALRPDLVLAGTATTRHTTRLLRDYGIPVLVLPGAESFDQVREQIRTVAHAVGEMARGEAVIVAMDARERELTTAQRGIDRIARATVPTAGPVATPYWAGGRSAGARTLYDDILRVGGFVNGGSQAGLQGYGVLPMERLVAQTPAVLLTNVSPRGMMTLGDRLLQHPALSALGAAEVALPSRLTICGGPWNLEAAALLAQRKGLP